MDTLETYLVSLQNKVFKLLPMREAYDRGEFNHLCEYIDNLCMNYAGGIACYPILADMREIIEVQINIIFLKNNITVDFKRWRSIVLRSTRLIHTAIAKCAKGV